MTWKNLARSGACAGADTSGQASLSDRTGVSSTRSGVPSILLVALFFFGGACDVAKADAITDTYGTGTSVMSWAYSVLHNVVPSVPYYDYYPFQPDYANAVFQGYVTTPGGTAIYPPGTWGPVYDPADQNSIFVFRTNVLSSVDQTISLTFGGDDQATAYVNGVLQDYSHIFTRGGHLDLSLTAGIPVFLELAIYNGPDGWVLGLTRDNGQSLIGNDSTITIGAVPEPASLWLVAVALVGLAGACKKRAPTRGDGRRLMS